MEFVYLVSFILTFCAVKLMFQFVAGKLAFFKLFLSARFQGGLMMFNIVAFAITLLIVNIPSIMLFMVYRKKEGDKLEGAQE